MPKPDPGRTTVGQSPHGVKSDRGRSFEIPVWSRVDALVVIADIANDLNQQHPLEKTLDGICARISAVTGALFALVRVPDGDRQHLVVRGSNQTGFESNRVEVLSLEDVAGGKSPSVDAFMSGRIRVIPDMYTEPGVSRWRSLAREQGFRSMVCIPLIQHSEVIGILNCYWEDPHSPGAGELELLQLVGRLAAVAIDTARVADGRRVTAAELQRLGDQLQDQNHQLVVLSKVQSRFIGVLAEGGASALEQTARILEEVVSRSIVIVDLSGRELAAAGRQFDRKAVSKTIGNGEMMRSLRQQPVLKSEDCTWIRIGEAAAPLGMIGLAPSLDLEGEVPILIAQQAAAVVAAYLYATREDRSLHAYARPATLLILTQGLVGSSQLRDAAGVLGVSADTTVRLGIVRCPTSEASHRLVRRVSTSSETGWPVIAAAAQGRDLLVLTDPSVTASAVDRFRERYPMVSSVGVSAPAHGLEHLREARDQAMVACELATQAGRTLFYEELGVFAELARSFPLERIREFVDRTLGQVDSYDKARGAHLIETLAAYVSHEGRVHETARDIGIHSNTLQQRLRRAATLSGLKLKSMRDLSQLVLALDWARLTGMLRPDSKDFS